MSARLDQYMLNLPDGMRDALKVSAAANKRSMNAEIVARLEASGKTLRDEFAMAAVGALLRIDQIEGGVIVWAAVAEEAYSMADAMLAARQNGGA